MKNLVHSIIMASFIGSTSFSYASPMQEWDENNNAKEETKASRIKTPGLTFSSKGLQSNAASLIFSYLPPHEVAKLSAVSKEWNSFVQDQTFLDTYFTTSLAGMPLTYKKLIGVKLDDPFSLQKAHALALDTRQSIKNYQQLLKWEDHYYQFDASRTNSIGDIFFERPEFKFRPSLQATIKVNKGQTLFSAFLQQLIDGLRDDLKPDYSLTAHLSEEQADDWLKAIYAYNFKREKENKRLFFRPWAYLREMLLQTSLDSCSVSGLALPSLQGLYSTYNGNLTDLTLEGFPYLIRVNISCNPQLHRLTIKNLSDLRALEIKRNYSLTEIELENLSSLDYFDLELLKIYKVTYKNVPFFENLYKIKDIGLTLSSKWLGSDAASLIFSYLPPHEVAKLSAVSTEWYNFIYDKRFLNTYRKTRLAKTPFLTYEALLELQPNEPFSLQKARVLGQTTSQCIKNYQKLLEWAPHYADRNARRTNSPGDIFFEHLELDLQPLGVMNITVNKGQTLFSAFLQQLVDSLRDDLKPEYSLMAQISEEQADDWLKAIYAYHLKSEKENQQLFFRPWVKSQIINLKIGIESFFLDGIYLPNFRILNCCFNKILRHLRLENFVNLQEISMGDNINLSSLTIKNISTLERLDLSNNSSLVEINLENLHALKKLNLDKNQSLKTLIIKNLLALEVTNISENFSMNTLNMENLPKLESFYVTSNNSISDLNVENFPTLKKLQIDKNQSLKSLTMKNLSDLEVFYFFSNNSINNLDMKNFSALKTINLRGNKSLNNIILINLTSLEEFDIDPSISDKIKFENVPLLEKQKKSN